MFGTIRKFIAFRSTGHASHEFRAALATCFLRRLGKLWEIVGRWNSIAVSQDGGSDFVD